MATLKRLMKRFGEEVGKLTFKNPAVYVYNPLDYAWAGQEAFIDKFFRSQGTEDVTEPRPTMLVGMNPGPYGMTQSGVAFGAPKLVRSWMEIDLPADAIRSPAVVCPARPIFGFSPVPITSTATDSAGTDKKKRRTAQPSLREEVSGKRIYVDWAMNTYPSAEAFFKEFYIHPYCPMQFMSATGTNITPDELHKDDRAKLYAVCDRYLREAIELLQPKRVIGIGNFADERIRHTLKRWRAEQEEEEDEDGDEDKEEEPGLLDNLVVGKIPHPSPRSPLARVVWGNRASKVNELLRGFGVEVPYTVPDVQDIADEEGGEEKETDVAVAMDREEAKSRGKRPAPQTATASHSSRAALPISKRRRTTVGSSGNAKYES